MPPPPRPVMKAGVVPCLNLAPLNRTSRRFANTNGSQVLKLFAAEGVAEETTRLGNPRLPTEENNQFTQSERPNGGSQWTQPKENSKPR